MTTYQEQVERGERRDRTVKLARTYLRKALLYLHPYRGDNNEIVEPLPPTGWYWDLLEETLEAAEEIIEALPDDYFEESSIEDYLGIASMLGVAGNKHNTSDAALDRLNKVVAAMERRRAAGIRRRLIEKLDNVEGRTPEEAAMYRAKADELRAKS